MRDFYVRYDSKAMQWVKKDLDPAVERGERRAAFLREADESAREFDRTGAHVQHDEVEAWIDSWGDDRPLAPPKCRV